MGRYFADKGRVPNQVCLPIEEVVLMHGDFDVLIMIGVGNSDRNSDGDQQLTMEIALQRQIHMSHFLFTRPGKAFRSI